MASHSFIGQSYAFICRPTLYSSRTDFAAVDFITKCTYGVSNGYCKNQELKFIKNWEAGKNLDNPTPSIIRHNNGKPTVSDYRGLTICTFEVNDILEYTNL